VYLSSNCDAFESGLEERYGDALYSLKVLRDANFPILIMTKNPSMLLKPDYSDAIDKSRTVIQTTIPFVDSRFEPYAPAPQSRLEAVGELVERGFKIVVRLDPVVPSSGTVKGRSEEEINRLVEQARGLAVRYLVSKCLRHALLTGTYGFFNATILKSLLSGQPIVLIDGVQSPASVNQDTNFWYVHITYVHSQHQVTIGGSNTVSEFPSAPALVILVLLSISILRRRRKR
jgi:hypothetical protein